MLDIRPDTPVILRTGYSETMTREKARALGVKEYLMKPVDYGHLARLLREVLDRRDRVAAHGESPTTATPLVE